MLTGADALPTISTERLRLRSELTRGQRRRFCSLRNFGSLRVLLVIAALGCSPNETMDEQTRDTIRDSVAARPPSLWYRQVRALDLTGDGQADTIRLEALGARPDSLNITLSLIVDREEKHLEQWGSSYELTLLDSAARAGPRVDVLLRAQLDSVLASVVVQRLSAPGIKLMTEDSVVLARLDPKPTHRVSFSYGYETTARLVWDAPRKRFVRLWSCC
jgi:hypothetical protein